MATGVEAAETGGAAGVAMEFPVNDPSQSSCSSSPPPPPPKVPRRIKQRLMECRSPSATTAEEIEAKLREADLRRQQFHEWLSTKARPKPRSPSWSSSQDDDPGQRLEAKLHAAEQKRLSILAKSKKRLARLDEIRQAAKNGVEMRFESKREELGSKVELRVQQAEANRLLLLKAHRQRRAAAKERTAKSLLQRMAQEKKYKECVRAAIYQKRAAAEKKRLGLLEAEKTRVHARVVQVQQVANSVNHQRETDRRKMKDQLEYRLQRARRQRAEYLRQRGNLHSIIRCKTDKQGEILSRKLARCWRRFMRSRRTTFSLVKDYEALGINQMFVKVIPFEQLALRIESAENLQTVKALLDRLEYRLVLSQAAISGASKSSNLNDIDHLLKRLASPKRRSPRDSAMKGRVIKKTGSSREGSQNQAKLSRYPVRVFLCAYMILGHPDAVFNGQGEREITLSQSASDLIHEFELLINIILDGSSLNTEQLSANMSSSRRTFRTQLQSFDAAWCSYLYNFVAWKVKDARSLEDDLVRAACQLELSMMQTCKLKAEGDIDSLSHDMKAIQKQVMEDQRLLRENVQRLSGEAGIERMECALSHTRSRFFEAKENGASPPIAYISSPNPPSSSPGSSSVSVSKERSLVAGDNENIAGDRRRSVARSLFGKDDSSQLKKHGLSTSSSNVGGLLGSSAEKLLMENELLVNEIVHDFHLSIANSFSTSDDDQNGIKAQIRATMEKAFWDGIAESLKEDKPDYSHVIELMKEVKDELCEMAPQNWREDIVNAIDLEILSQVLSSGNLDMEYFGKILDFSLATLRKLSALDKENEMMNVHKQLMDELHEISRDKSKLNVSFIVAMIKGLRFVLEQIQDLKREISKARVRMIEPFIKGPAGLDYLGKAFADRYGQPESAATSLPLTRSWLSLVWHTAEQEWNEHIDSLSVQSTTHGNSIHGLPLTTLRAGGNVPMASNQSHGIPSSATTGNQSLECTGEKVDVLVRLGMLNLVTAIEGLTQGTLPETLKLNFSRLRAVQAQYQKVAVMSISMLIFRQILVIEKVANNPVEMETIASKFVEQLNDLLDNVEDVGIKEVVEVMDQLSSEGAATLNEEQLQSRKQMMSNLLGKSLQAGDPVFTKVSRAIYLALRAILFGGTGPRGKELAETALRKVGAAALLEKVMEFGQVVCMVATVTNQVHGSWYREVIKSWN